MRNARFGPLTAVLGLLVACGPKVPYGDTTPDSRGATDDGGGSTSSGPTASGQGSITITTVAPSGDTTTEAWGSSTSGDDASSTGFTTTVSRPAPGRHPPPPPAEGPGCAATSPAIRCAPPASTTTAATRSELARALEDCSCILDCAQMLSTGADVFAQCLSVCNAPTLPPELLALSQCQGQSCPDCF